MDVILVNSLDKSYNSSSGFKFIAELFGFRKINSENNKIRALTNITFQVTKGEAFGIIGSNGSGKSTLLQIIAGTLTPTSGLVKVNGRVSALLELGSGFNPEFTGIENIYLSGSILGISKDEMFNKIKSITDFADIGDFINQPVRTYSSGMLMRVAFAVAISVEPDVLIIDEALSVGDILFQQKCNAKLKDLLFSGITLLVVTHDTSFVLNICNRALWLDRGETQYLGFASECVKRYLAAMAAKSTEYRTTAKICNDKSYNNIPTSRPLSMEVGTRLGDYDVFVKNVWLENDQKLSTNVFELGNWAFFTLELQGSIYLEKISCGLEIRDRHGQVVFAVGLRASNKLIAKLNKNETRFVSFKVQLNLAPGQYTLDVGCGAGDTDSNVGQRVMSLAIIEIIPSSSGEIVHGLVRLPYEIQI